MKTLLRRRAQDKPAAADAASGLDPALRSKAEASLGTDLGDVRVHQGAEARDANAQLGSKAFAHGADIVLGAGVENSANPILAHEVAHTVQQRGARPSVAPKMERGPSGGVHEREADRAATHIMAGQPARVERAGFARIQCFESNEHKLIGDEATRNAQGQNQGIELAADYFVSYGDLVAISGDFVGSIDEVKALAAKPGPGKGTREELDYIRQVKIPNNDALEGKFSDGAKNAVNERYYHLATTNKSHFVNPLKGDVGKSQKDKDAERQPAGKKDPLEKGEGLNAGASYQENHQNALLEAAGAGKSGKSIDGALAIEAFSNHFLTDSFSAGHLRTARADVGGYWDAKIPMFFPNFKGYMSEQIAKNMKSDGSFKSKAATKLSVDEVTHADNFAFKGTAPTIDETLKEKGVPPFGFGDMVSAALHDYDNKNGVVATVDGQTVTLYGDGSIMSADGQPLAKGASTKALAVKAVQVSVEDVRKAYQAGKQGQDSANIVNGFKDEKGFFAAERMIPQVVPDADPAQIHKTIKWDYDSVDGLMADQRAADALALTGRLKARELAAIGDSLDAKFKKDAFKAGVVDPLVSDPLAFLKQVINYVPNTGGGIGGHNTDDEAMDYLASARATPGGIASLSVEQKRKIIMDVVSGYTSGSEEAGILEVLGAKREDAAALIDSVGWHRLWKAIDGAHCRAFVEQFGPDYWSARSLGDKEAEVKFLADGRTNDLAQETIIVILRTCSPADVRRIDDEVGGRLGLKWDLTGKWDTEFKRMKAGG